MGDEDDCCTALAEQLEIPYVSLHAIGVDPSTARLLPAELGVHYGVIPVCRIGARIRVAFADPYDEEALAAVAEYIPPYTPVVAELSEIELAWRTVAPSVAA